MLETYKNTSKKTITHININLDDDKHLEQKPKTIRINEFVFSDWNEFCKQKNYTKKDLTSMALKEYMEKYK